MSIIVRCEMQEDTLDYEYDYVTSTVVVHHRFVLKGCVWGKGRGDDAKTHERLRTKTLVGIKRTDYYVLITTLNVEELAH